MRQNPSGFFYFHWLPLLIPFLLGAKHCVSDSCLIVVQFVGRVCLRERNVIAECQN